jgi:hypothetical protein
MAKRWKASRELRRAWERKYDALHRRRRAIAAVKVAKGEVVCRRCGLPISPGEPWDLGHDDEDPKGRQQPEHRYCNRSAAGRRTRERHRRITSLEL